VFKTLPRIRYSPKLGHSGERGAGRSRGTLVIVNQHEQVAYAFSLSLS